MQISMLLCKLHRVTVTHSELQYEGSCAIDTALLENAGIRPFQAIDIYNVTNGERFSTYAIEGGPGIISVNGAAARKAAPGDVLIIAAYGQMTPEEADSHKPKLVYVGGQNRVRATGYTIPRQA